MTEVIKDFVYRDCKFEINGPVATFTISNPAARNAYSKQTWEGMFNAAQVVREDDSIKVLVLTGDPEGKTFCAGLNVKNLAKNREKSNQGERVEEPWTYNQGSQYDRMKRDKGAIYGSTIPTDAISPGHAQYMWWREQELRGGYWRPRPLNFVKLPKPVIAMVNGAAMGAGCDLAFHCDIIIASEQAFFGWNYLHRGMVTAEGGCYFLPRLCGYHRTLEILFTGDRISAQQAYEWDLINHVVPHDELESYTYNLAQRIATESPPLALGMIKYAVQRGFNDYVHNLELVHEEVIRACNRVLAQTNDALEGMKAFVEKRKPNYTGT